MRDGTRQLRLRNVINDLESQIKFKEDMISLANGLIEAELPIPSDILLDKIAHLTAEKMHLEFQLHSVLCQQIDLEVKNAFSLN